MIWRGGEKAFKRATISSFNFVIAKLLIFVGFHGSTRCLRKFAFVFNIWEQPTHLSLLWSVPRTISWSLSVRVGLCGHIGIPLPWRRGKRVSVSRFSIHPSNKSQSLTTIKFTQICEGQIYTSVLYTTAIKKTNSFCPFVFIASSKTNVKRDIAKSSARRIILDMVDDRCTFLYSLAVGQRETPFLWSPLEYINSKQIKFNKFSIVILYAFVTIPSSDYGSALTVNTKDIMRPFDGLSVLDCCHYFNTFIKELKGRLILMYKTANSPQSTLDISKELFL